MFIITNPLHPHRTDRLDSGSALLQLQDSGKGDSLCSGKGESPADAAPPPSLRKRSAFLPPLQAPPASRTVSSAGLRTSRSSPGLLRSEFFAACELQRRSSPARADASAWPGDSAVSPQVPALHQVESMKRSPRKMRRPGEKEEPPGYCL